MLNPYLLYKVREFFVNLGSHMLFNIGFVLNTLSVVNCNPISSRCPLYHYPLCKNEKRGHALKTKINNIMFTVKHNALLLWKPG